MRVTPDQAAKLREAVGQRLEWFGESRERMEKAGVSASDPIYIEWLNAYRQLAALHVACEERSREKREEFVRLPPAPGWHERMG